MIWAMKYILGRLTCVFAMSVHSGSVSLLLTNLRDWLPDSKGSLLSETPSQTIAQGQQEVQNYKQYSTKEQFSWVHIFTNLWKKPSCSNKIFNFMTRPQPMTTPPILHCKCMATSRTLCAIQHGSLEANIREWLVQGCEAKHIWQSVHAVCS